MLDINEHPELEKAARKEIIDYLHQEGLYHTIYDDLAMLNGNMTEEELDELFENHISNMFVYAWQAVAAEIYKKQKEV